MRALFVVAAIGAGVGTGCSSASATSNAPSAEVIFDSVCARCHGADGSGGLRLPDGTSPRNFRDPVFQAERSDAQIRAAIIDGKNGAMPGFGQGFGALVIDGLVARIRSFDPRKANP